MQKANLGFSNLPNQALQRTPLQRSGAAELDVSPAMLRNIAELFRYLDSTLDPKIRAEIAGLDESQVSHMHFGFNLYLRNLAFYGNPSVEGKDYFAQLGDPDGASGLVGEMYWAHLRHLPITLEYVKNSAERHCLFLFESDALAKWQAVVDDYYSEPANG